MADPLQQIPAIDQVSDPEKIRLLLFLSQGNFAHAGLSALLKNVTDRLASLEETNIADMQARIASLEAQVADLEARVTDLETP